MPISARFRRRVAEKLCLLYDDRADAVLRRIDELADRYTSLRSGRAGQELWNEQTAVLITYGDQVQQPGRAALEVLRQFLLDFELNGLISTLHLLPFFPYSSDDGFSVIDYRRVDRPLGDWDDVARMRESFRLVFDLVLNHCSRHHQWFRQYLRAEPPYTEYFIEVDPATDLSRVVRPRSTPLLTPFETRHGTKHVWTTFSADQVDLNYANPDVLIEILDTLLLYAQQGASVIRLDAIAYLWKTIGTSCIHLPQTHAVVKLMRDLVDDVAKGTVLLTETNVPHKENVSYFGQGDEAHAVYQFSLAPLLLDAYLTGDARDLMRWLSHLEQPDPGTTFLNFTASHDGIGVRPLEGLLPPERLDALVDAVRQRGGRVSMKRNPDGTDSPYELNISYVSALDSPTGLSAQAHTQRFLGSQAVMLALRGIPGIYFHSLVGTPNWDEGVHQTGHARSINRRKFQHDELRRILGDKNGRQRRIFDGYRKMLAVRAGQKAFHPDADQVTLDMGQPSVIALLRTSLARDQRVLVLANVSDRPVTVDLSRAADVVPQRDLLSSRMVTSSTFELGPSETVWLS